ncbi:hypothetical protein GMB86_02380 [Terrilactibacillus sp. BCM23-1]|uniref:Uncharacterized protein n=1 Tax=Terrilactibacillus tamarindi TaxID=2599694 RepID=A0A6N8CMU6_9BACI|nr:hypothetical protein [Terrilactibacillus tamarindi]MTT30860.1 hypothetical protein [Terrilactibacillus tamarindi]
MKVLSNLHDLREAKEKIETYKNEHEETFSHLLHLVNLTRQLQFKYDYLCGIIMGEDVTQVAPHFVQDSIIDLYKNEINKIDQRFHDLNALKSLLRDCRNIGYENFCLLVKGKTPEEIKGIYRSRKMS